MSQDRPHGSDSAELHSRRRHWRGATIAAAMRPRLSRDDDSRRCRGRGPRSQHVSEDAAEAPPSSEVVLGCRARGPCQRTRSVITSLRWLASGTVRPLWREHLRLPAHRARRIDARDRRILRLVNHALPRSLPIADGGPRPARNQTASPRQARAHELGHPRTRARHRAIT